MLKINKKTILLSLAFLLGARSAVVLPKATNDYKEVAQTGDLIFQTQIGRSQSLAIQAATLSPYNHVGVVVKSNGKFYVYEAHGPVKKIPLSKYTSRRGTGKRFVVYRHKEISKKDNKKVVAYLKQSYGKKYDVYLNWDSSKMYCSELAYKALNHAGLKLEKPRKVKDMSFALNVGKLIPNSYKLKKLNPDMKVVAPSHLSRDINLEKVFQNW